MDHSLIYEGKVRNIYKHGEKHLLMKTSDRVSSFDKHIGIINGKGELLNKMTEFWFDKTQHIIDNHLVSHLGPGELLVKKCDPIMLEIVVRGYITGCTNTSLWTHYKKGIRTYCGVTFPNDLRKNEKLENSVITPTTKGKEDKPISKKEIIDEGILTTKECDFIYKKAMELFIFGQRVAEKAGYILVDTKYEFGKDSDGNIILIDEIHTTDSSRYWIKETYEKKFSNGEEPDKFDKDCVRDWVRSVCDPYKDTIPTLPKEIIDKTYNNILQFYNNLNSVVLPKVGIIMGSDSDLLSMKDAGNILGLLSIPFEMTIVSAHRTPKRMFNYATEAYNKGIKVIIAGAGGAAHLPGMVASLTTLPVIGVPVRSKALSGVDSLLSIVQMPRGVPVATVSIGNSKNAGLLAARMLAVDDVLLKNKLVDYHYNIEKDVEKKAIQIERELSLCM